jgi:SAM-dependent methyltransferase/uncharacterized protein YbaR (Trm112 family)
VDKIGVRKPQKSLPWDVIRCPRCLDSVEAQGEQAFCRNPACRTVYPIVSGIPVLINESSSVFSFEDFKVDKATFFKARSKFLEWVNQHAPSVSHNLAAARNYRRLAELLLQQSPTAHLLVIGGSIAGEGFDALCSHSGLDLVETDVSFGPRVSIICDGHDLPFADGSFDAVIAQAVLEHVVDPIRCVSEMQRVLRKGGLIYSETPFMQQVHGGRYDFARFTHRGHRRLFKHFEEVHSGMIGGAGMALAWSWQYFLRSFGRSVRAQVLLSMAGRLTAFYFKYFDYILQNIPGSYDAASGFYFMGRKSDSIMSDRALVQTYSAIRSSTQN